MFLFKMHSIGSVRPVPRASAVANQWWGTRAHSEPMKQAIEPTHNQLEEDVVVIQEEEMVLVRKEEPQPQPEEQSQHKQEEQPQQPQCTEPESTVVAPSSKPKYKKKQQKRK